MITSTSNQHIKDIRHLRDRKYRSECGLFYVEGIRLVTEAVNQKDNLQEIIYSSELSRSQHSEDLIKNAKKEKILIEEVSSEVFHSLSSKDGPQGLAAIVKQSWTILKTDQKLIGVWTALYEIADPGNLGTILRTSDAVGGKGIILIGDSTDPFDPTSVRASMGAIFTQKIIKTNMDSFVSWKTNSNCQVIGTSDHAKMDYKEFDYSSNTILLMGSERQGIPSELEEICTEVVSIPMKGKCDSLNLAVATSIMLYEIFEQNRKRS
jgi:TrmH family RNA methyltransferase